MKLVLIASILAALCAISIPSVEGQSCPNIYLYVIGSNLTDIKNLTLSSDFASIDNSVYYQRSKKTLFYTGGWFLDYETFDAQTIFQAYLDTKRSEWNLVYIDWSFYTKDMFFVSMVENMGCYANTAYSLIDKFRNTLGASPSNFHFVGFNFGAHLAGYTARKFTWFGTVKRLTALDPGAALGFTRMIFARYFFTPVVWTDADTVDIIHTSAGKIGYEVANGHIDFYVNGGSTQEGCTLLQSIQDFRKNQSVKEIYRLVCSHSRAVYYYAESVRRSVGGARPFISSRCGLVWTYSPETCSNTADQVSMGYYAVNPPGISAQYSKRFYVQTNKVPSFSLT